MYHAADVNGHKDARIPGDLPRFGGIIPFPYCKKLSNNFCFILVRFYLQNAPVCQGDEHGHVQSRQEFTCGFPGFGRLHSVGCAGSSACGSLQMNRFELADLEWSAIGSLLPNKRRGVLQEYDRHPEGAPIEDHLPVGSFLPGDKAYEAGWIRKSFEEQDAMAINPDRSNAEAARASSQVLDRPGNRIKCSFAKPKQFGRIANRCEKLAVNHLAMIKLASTRIWLRANESAPLRHDLEIRARVPGFRKFKPGLGDAFCVQGSDTVASPVRPRNDG